MFNAAPWERQPHNFLTHFVHQLSDNWHSQYFTLKWVMRLLAYKLLTYSTGISITTNTCGREVAYQVTTALS